MTALAELLVGRGVVVSGADTEERFYTDAILAELGVEVFESFDPALVPADVEAVIYSAAYDPGSHPQLVRALELGLRPQSYTEALGEISATRFAAGIAGVHGKTTTAAMVGVLVRELQLPGAVLVGSAVAGFGGRSTYNGGDCFLVAETCEYKRHFLSFHPDVLLITGIEPDHLDYYRDLADIKSAFADYARRLSRGGALVYCADDAAASEVSRAVAAERPDISLVPYGHDAQGAYRLLSVTVGRGEISFRIEGWDGSFSLRVPGEHNALNAVAALAVTDQLLARFAGRDTGAASEVRPSPPPDTGTASTVEPESRRLQQRALAAFGGTRRRAEVLGEAAGVLFVDDYAHHPTAIVSTLAGLRAFHPDRRLIVDFMSHTYSRTAALLEQFARSFVSADVVILHKIYASARERFDGNISGKMLADRTRIHHSDVRYFEEIMDAFDHVMDLLRPGDLFVTMGAGNNWQLGERLLAALKEKNA